MSLLVPNSERLSHETEALNKQQKYTFVRKSLNMLQMQIQRLTMKALADLRFGV